MKNKDEIVWVTLFNSMINYVLTCPIKWYVFEKLCKDMVADHKTLLFYSKTPCVCIGKILTGLLELKEEPIEFFVTIDVDCDYCKCLYIAILYAELVYLSDNFNNLNSLNQVCRYVLKSAHWISTRGENNLFPSPATATALSVLNIGVCV